eukprot:Gb_40210 [translate_table: standard]
MRVHALIYSSYLLSGQGEEGRDEAGPREGREEGPRGREEEGGEQDSRAEQGGANGCGVHVTTASLPSSQSLGGLPSCETFQNADLGAKSIQKVPRQPAILPRRTLLFVVLRMLCQLSCNSSNNKCHGQILEAGTQKYKHPSRGGPMDRGRMEKLCPKERRKNVCFVHVCIGALMHYSIDNFPYLGLLQPCGAPARCAGARIFMTRKMLDVGRRSCDIPLTKQLTALRRARSLRDPVTSSSRKFSASIVNSSWESPACKSESVRDGTNEDEHGCNNQFVSASSREEAGKLMGSKREEKNELSSKGSGVLNWDLTNVKHAQDCEREMEEPSINSSERLVTRENVSKRRDNNKGEKSLLHNWRNERHNDEADEFVESGAESKERDLIKNERRGQFRRHQSESHGSGREEEHNSVEIQGEERRTTMKQGRRGRSFKKTLSSCRKDSVSRKSITSLSSALSDEAPAGALSLLSLEEDEPCAVTHFCNGENDVGFSRMRRDCASQSGSPLLMSDALKSREQKAKCNKKRHSSSISKYIGRQKDDSHTPTSICSFNRNDDCKSSMRGSCDGTAFSGDDEMDGLDVPRHGCGIPCYWSRTPKHRSKSFLDCAGWSLPHGLADTVRRKGGNMPSRNKTCSLKDSTLHACNSKRSVHKLNFDMEALPLLTDEGESAELSGEDGSDEPYDDFGELFLEDDAELGRRISRHRRREKLELALTSESRELTVYADTHRSLSQKYRPRAFDEMVGQNMVVQSLVNAVLKGKVAPVYLFQGPRGTGKTSTARIFAAALNCLSLEELRPCGFCRECTAFASGKSVDVREVDATSSNGMERVKALLKNVASAPSFSRFKIFIIDECHMLVCETWTALLKSLEEPPGHVVFIFITTDPDKLPRTAVSRCQKYLFPKIKESEIVSRLQKLAVEENLDVDTDALDLIAMKSDGSLRDAETMLDQLSLLGQRITLSLVHELHMNEHKLKTVQNLWNLVINRALCDNIVASERGDCFKGFGKGLVMSWKIHHKAGLSISLCKVNMYSTQRQKDV